MALGAISRTSRGFEYIEFIDSFGKTCSLQQSSTIGPADGSDDARASQPGASRIWLGVDRGDVGPTRMHLDRSQVIDLIEQLQHWVDTGKFRLCAKSE